MIAGAAFPKKGTHSVVVTHQHCDVLGKQDNSQVPVNVSPA
ncbi:MAG: transposase [Comamonadaceae bacterium]|nr:transposase [Comamonadaceae bacterium]MBK9200143.1 transposase [Betaproteobacteria bacterium]MBP7133463.1 transposase [Aquabacterium sp.]MBP8100484.1 transposase [Burkholderiaceae bacterium]MBK6557067.1 transposase [Comamonadaceae bacterium]